MQQLSTEREEREREKWSLLRHARDEAERSLSLAAQLAAKDAHIQQLQENLDEVRGHFIKSFFFVIDDVIFRFLKNASNAKFFVSF